ncbi:MAG: EAL domain-containing protein [Gammaproteobacteria bacterium]
MNAPAVQKLTISRGIGRLGTWRWHAPGDRFEEFGLWTELLGYGPDVRPTTSQELTTYVHPDDVPRMRAAYRACVKGDTPEYEAEHRLRAADGSYRWVLSRARVTQRDLAGRTLQMEGVYLDLSRFKAAEQALRESQQFLRLVLDTIPVSVFWKDAASRYLGCNSAFARDVGLPDTDAVRGLTDLDLPWAADAVTYQAEDRRVMAAPDVPPMQSEARVRHVRGTERWHETTKAPLRDTHGAVFGVLGTFQDVTERHQRLHQLETLATAFATGSGTRLLTALLRAATDLSGARVAFVARIVDAGARAAVTAIHPPEFAVHALDYPIAGTPCALTMTDGSHLAEGAALAGHPGADRLRALGFEAYAGRRLDDENGRPIGLLVLLGEQRFPDPAALSSVLEIVAMSAASELARERREQELIEQRERLDLASANSQLGFWEWHLRSGELRALVTASGNALDACVPASAHAFMQALDPPARRALRRALTAYLRGRAALFEEEIALRMPDGQVRWLLLRGRTAARDAGGSALRLIGTHTDVTSMKTTELALEQARRFLGTVIDTIPQSVYWKDRNARYLGCNRTFATLAGLQEPGEIIGLTDLDLPWHALAPRLRMEDEDILRGRTSHIRTEDCLTGRHGEDIWLEKNKVAFRDADGRIMGVLGTTHDITERKRSEDEIERLAFFDPLTLLPNRRYFKERLDAAVALAQRREFAGALLYLDLDHFKKINDTLGHSAGDRLLVEASERIRQQLRQEDVVARIGGDEFVVMLGDLSMDAQHCAQQARTVANKIRAELSRPFMLDDDELYVTSTIGIAVFPEHHDSSEELLKMADAAMYRGKTEGRNTVFFFNPELLAEAGEKLRLENLLRTAVERGELSLHYQPQVDAQGRVIGAEALMRWHSPVLGPVSPARFIPVAEESGLIDEIGMWAIHEALAALERWRAAGVPIGHHLAVNVSQRQFSSPRFVPEVVAALTAHDVPPGMLALELTETAAAERVEETITRMEELRSAGVSFSIDDFGVGYSSLSYLARLPLQQLKIDRSFITDVEHDRTKGAIIATLLTLGENLGLTVVAEGVETAPQWQRLVERGCRVFQGYLFSRPLNEADFLKFCTASTRRPELLPALGLSQIA